MVTQTFQFSYSSMSARLQSYLEDGDVDFLSQIPNIIQLGELRVHRDLDLEMRDEEFVVQFDSAGSATKPDRMATVRDVLYEGALLEERAISVLRVLQSQTSSGIPRYYAETSETKISVAPVPAAGIGSPFPSEVKQPNDFLYPAESAAILTVRGVVVPETLSLETQTTWVSTHFGDLLFAACLVECERFNKNTEMEQTRDVEYINILRPSVKQIKPQHRKDYARGLSTSLMATQESA